MIIVEYCVLGILRAYGWCDYLAIIIRDDTHGRWAANRYEHDDIDPNTYLFRDGAPCDVYATA